MDDAYFLASVFLFLLAGITSTLTVFGKSYIDFSGSVSLAAATLHCKGEGSNETCYRLKG